MMHLAVILVDFAILAAALWLIATTLRTHAQAILSALAGTPDLAVNKTFYRRRAPVRTVAVRRLSQPLRAAA